MECWIKINSESGRTEAIKLFDSTGNLETVMVVNKREVNIELPEDCFTPDLESRGYKPLTDKLQAR